MSHTGRYQRLNHVRAEWFERAAQEREGIRVRTIYLDGAWIDDVPSFYLSLGEAVNGPNGYFGAGLDALADCLSGGFGILPPLTIHLSHFERVQEVLDGRAWCRFRAEAYREAIAAGESTEFLSDCGYVGDGTPKDVARWATCYEAALAGEPFDAGEFGSYFDAIAEVLTDAGAALLPASAPPYML